MSDLIKRKLNGFVQYLRWLADNLLDMLMQLKAKIYRKQTLAEELQRCQIAAEEGCRLAEGNYNEIQNTLSDAKKALSEVDRKRSKVDTEQIETQKKGLRRLENSIKPIGDDLQKLRGRLNDFSIVVYGRTEAGKSTLMEILTHGNGDSIGNGSQRTTLDVRSYDWNGLKITDVPGICAFSKDPKDARRDEQLALEAAKTADLVLFLITSDAPQPDEAKKLAQLKSLGKPVLGIINVKMSFNINDELDIEDLQKKLADTKTIDDTINQFKKFAALYNQDWNEMKFVATHLLAAYQAQNKNPKVFKLSRFSKVEDFIIDKICNDGRFLRMKNFVDGISVPMSDVILEIYKYSAASLRMSSVWLDKYKQFDDWSKNFKTRSNEKFDRLHGQLKSELETAITDFVRDHYEDKNAGKNWEQRFKNLKFAEKYQTFLKNLAGEYDRKCKELSDELKQELPYVLQADAETGIQLDDATPWGQNISVGMGAVGGVALAAVAAELAAGTLLGPVGIALSIAGILGGFLFNNREENIRENKRKLSEAISDPSRKKLQEMHDQASRILETDIYQNRVDAFKNSLADYQMMTARLGNSQSEMAKALFFKFSHLNSILLIKADVAKFNHKVARIPGEIVVVFAAAAQLNRKRLSRLFDEKFLIYPQENPSQNLQAILGCDYYTQIYPLSSTLINPKKTTAILLKEKVDATKFKIAQQIAGVPIITR